MATETRTTEKQADASGVPPLQTGDRLTQAEFHRRYEAMPQLKKAELIEGVVYVPSPVSAKSHGAPHFDLIGWLALYRSQTPGVEGGDNTTLLLDIDNEPQPDAYLRIRPEMGGQSRTTDEGYIEGAPELIAEVAASSASYDLHDKLNAYRRNGVREYLVWRVWDQEVDWFTLHEGRYERLSRTEEDWYQSQVFPGLWLDVSALLAGDLNRVLEGVQKGLADPSHVEFVKHLGQQAEKNQNASG